VETNNVLIVSLFVAVAFTVMKLIADYQEKKEKQNKKEKIKE